MDKVRKWNITLNSNQDAVMSFLERIDEVTNYHQFTQEELVKGIPMFLKAKASEWYRNNMETWRIWEEFSDDLRNIPPRSICICSRKIVIVSKPFTNQQKYS